MICRTFRVELKIKPYQIIAVIENELSRFRLDGPMVFTSSV